MLNKKVGLIVLLAAFSCGDLLAVTLTNFTVGDVLVCFRKPSSGNDLVVDAGQASVFINGTNNQRFSITNYNGGQLALIGTNSTTWSALGYYDDSVSPANLQWTVFYSRGRSSFYKASNPWIPETSTQQMPSANDVSTIPVGAAVNINYEVPTNSGYAIVEPDDTSGTSPNYPHGNCYDYQVDGDGNGDINGDWQGNVEVTTPSTFVTGGKVVRSDFYEVSPTDTGTGKTTSLGYFELNTNGAMTFISKPAAPTVTTLAASGTGTTNSQLNGTVNPIGDPATVYFQYGLTTTYGSTSTTNLIGTAPGTYGLSISNLVAATMYHFRVVAYNRAGTNAGSDLTFTTSGGVAVATPIIKNFGRTNITSYVTFTTGGSGTYTLRGTNMLAGGSVTNWPAINSTPGNGAVNILQDTTTISNKFYVITAQ